jgi:hypothetical protein
MLDQSAHSRHLAVVPLSLLALVLASAQDRPQPTRQLLLIWLFQQTGSDTVTGCRGPVSENLARIPGQIRYRRVLPTALGRLRLAGGVRVSALWEPMHLSDSLGEG